MSPKILGFILDYPKRRAARARAFSTSSSRFRGGALVASESIRVRAICETSATARSKTT